MAKDDAALEITYRSAELQPPLWVAGSFSNPPWTPLKMKHRMTPDGEHVFTKAIHAKPGAAIQYKFRVGSGDWWVLDESLPTVTDDMGNRNNLLRVHDHKSIIAQKPPTPPPDSPTLRTTDVGQSNLQVPLTPTAPPPKGSVEGLALGLGGPSRSNASTPSFVRTTIEVADSAAQIDARTPDSEMSDQEGKPSSVPAFAVAGTGAEFADTDAISDSSIDSLDMDIGPEFAHERPSEVDNGQDEAPMFAYEFAGSYGLPLSTTETENGPESYPFPEKDKEPEFDPKDPTLERFPSNREEILSHVRTIQTGLDEDIPTFEGFPASPIVSSGRKSSMDMTDDFFLISPTTIPSRPPANRHPEAHKRAISRDSLVLNPSPSLQCIIEEPNVDEDDEGLLLPEPAEADETLSPDNMTKTAPHKSAATSVESPLIVVHGAEEAEGSKSMDSTVMNAHPRSILEPEESSTLSLADAREDINDQPQSGTQVSNHLTGIEVRRGPNWFVAFIKLVFVDWLGSFFGSVFRWRRSE